MCDTGHVLTTHRQHVVACINVEDLSELPESHGAVVLPLEVCRRVWRGGFATISWKQLLHLESAGHFSTAELQIYLCTTCRSGACCNLAFWAL